MFSSASRAQFWREKKINNWKIGEKNLKAQCEPPLKNYRLTISGNRHRSYDTVNWVCGVRCVCALLSRMAWWTLCVLLVTLSHLSRFLCATLIARLHCSRFFSVFLLKKKTIFIARSTGSIPKHITQCWCIPSVYLNLYGNQSLPLSLCHARVVMHWTRWACSHNVTAKLWWAARCRPRHTILIIKIDWQNWWKITRIE